MPPINQKKLLKNLHIDKKQERKKYREQKLLRAAAEFKKDLKEVVTSEEEHEEEISSSQDIVSRNSLITHGIGPSYTISIAVPGSILDNAQSPELRTYLAGQIARAACISCVDESTGFGYLVKPDALELTFLNFFPMAYVSPTKIIVFDDLGTQNNNGIRKPGENSCEQMARLLQYLECPQYLRKHIFPLHKDLQYAGLLNPLDAPHHLRQTDDFPFREGVVSHHQVKPGKGSYVNVGLLREVCVDKALHPDIRVTVKLLPQKKNFKKRYGLVVPPSQPRKELGVYWGYTVRLASCLSDVFTKSPYSDGYDLTIGTSDKGAALDQCDDSDFSHCKHCLIVFGGLEGLESALESDENLSINNVALLFDKYLNTCPKQGSRTIRTEEAILISLPQLVSKISSMNPCDKDVDV